MLDDKPIAKGWQAMKEQGGTLTIELEQTAVDADTAILHPNLEVADYVRLSVVDTGIGMTEETLENIFEPFYTTKGKEQGIGLGLSVSHEIILNHNGEIMVESDTATGTSFHVYLPLCVDEHSERSRTPQSLPRGEESILLIDDDGDVLDVIKLMTEKLGYKVTALCNGVDALEYLTQNPGNYDLVISGLTMPGMTGLELAKELRKNRSLTPIIIMTGNIDSAPVDAFENLKISKIMEKPVSIQDLAHGIREALAQANRRQF